MSTNTSRINKGRRLEKLRCVDRYLPNQSGFEWCGYRVTAPTLKLLEGMGVTTPQELVQALQEDYGLMYRIPQTGQTARDGILRIAFDNVRYANN